MVEPAEILAELQRRYALDWEGQAPIREDIEAWAGGSLEAEMALYDNVAAELARGYFEKRYSFYFCDAVVNQLYCLMLEKTDARAPTALAEALLARD